MKPDPKNAERIRKAYQPIRDDSTFEFTIENVGVYEGGAIAFGLVTKGTICEGHHLRLIPENGKEIDCVCRAIAGLTERLAQTSSQGSETNIGIWLDIPHSKLKVNDRLISFNTPVEARPITPPNLRFSILYWIQKG